MGPDATPHELGGRLCLAVVNTVLWRRSGQPVELLREYPDLVRAVGRAGWLAAPAELAAAAAAEPEAAGQALARAVALREALFRLFSAVAAGAEPADHDLAALNGPL